MTLMKLKTLFTPFVLSLMAIVTVAPSTPHSMAQATPRPPQNACCKTCVRRRPRTLSHPHRA
ncbi:MAG: hypothetical protein H7237_08530 [Alkalinema sp. FL-bin-369]|nr:hypothetical protein [Leptolyngbyaceae cyanobacterium LF-bin-369]